MTMKKILLSAVAVLALVPMLSGQARDVTVTITDAKGKPMKNLEVYSYVKGSRELFPNTPGQVLTLEDVGAEDILSVVAGNRIYEIPIAGADSVHIYMKNRNTVRGYSLDGSGRIVTDITSYPAESEEWVKGAVDHATSYMYFSLLDYIQARVPSLRPIRTRTGVELTIRGTGNRQPALIVVDGVEYPSFDLVNSVYRPWQIKSIEVDRIGTLYGFRGQNGVVHITTLQNQ